MIAGINEILVEDAGIIALVGQNTAADKIKVYPVVAPSGESLPYLTTSLVRADPTLHKDSKSTLDARSFAVHVHTKSYDETDELSEAVREALDQKQSVTDTGYTFDRIWYVNEYDRPEMYNAEKPAYVRTLVFNAQVRRT